MEMVHSMGAVLMALMPSIFGFQVDSKETLLHMQYSDRYLGCLGGNDPLDEDPVRSRVRVMIVLSDAL